MTDFSALLQQGIGNAWLFIPSAILLGALHGLEPGHSKTMMAAFIVAVRGTIKQAVLLGLAATLSHTTVVWLIAFGGMYLSRQFTAEASEPYFQLISAVIILATALWMFWRTWRGEQQWKAGHEPHEHDESQLIDTGHGQVELSIFEQGMPPHWRLKNLSGQHWGAQKVTVTTLRENEAPQLFEFEEHGDFLQSVHPIPEPHHFTARLSLTHGGHSHDYEVMFQEHDHAELTGLDVSSQEYQDAHEKAHASDIKRRFANRNVTTGQIVLFGLTGGLIPCPAAITVLLLCIQVKAFTLGAALVLCFSIGLAITLVAVGVAAAYSVQRATQRWSGFNTLARRAPYFSSVLIAVVGIYMGYHGWAGLMK
ncbi:nickel/cobalt efflux protein RcnA [Serratia sp. D1N4]